MSRVVGHALRAEGAAFRPNGTRVWPVEKGTLHHGQCECGALSPAVLTNAQRKRWHVWHKEQVSGGAQ